MSTERVQAITAKLIAEHDPKQTEAEFLAAVCEAYRFASIAISYNEWCRELSLTACVRGRGLMDVRRSEVTLMSTTRYSDTFVNMLEELHALFYPFRPVQPEEPWIYNGQHDPT